MSSFLFWCSVVASTTLGAGAAGMVVALMLRGIGLEYLVVVCNRSYEALLLEWWAVIPFGLARGARMGLALGTFLAACAVVGRRRRSRTLDTVAGECVVLTGALALSMLSAAVAYAFARCGWLKLSPSVGRQVGCVYRVVASYGLTYGALAGGWLSAVAAGIFIFRRREQSGHGETDGSRAEANGP